MAQQPRTDDTDFDALFEEAAELDGLPVSGDIMPGDDVATAEPVASRAQSQEQEPAQVADDLDRDDFWQNDQPLDGQAEEEQQLSPEEQAEQERLALLAEGDDLIRRQREFAERTGRPIIPPEQQQQNQQRQEAVTSLRQDTPEVAAAVDAIVQDRVDQAVRQAVGAVQQDNAETTEALLRIQHDNAILASDVGDLYDAVRKDPAQMEAMQQWIAGLPTAVGTSFLDVLEQGTPVEVIGMFEDYRAFPDSDEATEHYRQALSHKPAEERQEQSRPKGRSTKARWNVPEAALAVRSRGASSIPVASGGQTSDEFDAAYQEWGVIEREEERRAANER
ncbi:MAG: hypothetical protein KGL39_06630 [Patescibacteria group bacterium]|nr:hypothetical protein [Patescibacteria group bacterium]